MEVLEAFLLSLCKRSVCINAIYDGEGRMWIFVIDLHDGDYLLHADNRYVTSTALQCCQRQWIPGPRCTQSRAPQVRLARFVKNCHHPQASGSGVCCKPAIDTPQSFHR